MAITYTPIGTIHSPHEAAAGTPIQPAAAAGINGIVEVFSEYSQALADLDGFSHIILIYHFHQADGWQPRVIPFMDTVPRGLFSTRAPKRPNPIGLSVVKLVRVEQNRLHVTNVDILNQTPLLDIKPYAPEFDHHPADRAGWLDAARGKVATQTADDRFT